MNELLYLSRKDVEAASVGLKDIISAIEEMFKLKGAGEVEMPPKPGIHPRKNSFLHAMPAYIKGKNEVAGLKWVGGYPENSKRNLPYISGLFILNDPATGLPLCVMDCTWLTAMRTGAATAVAAKYLARPESRTLGIIGCGVQGRSNLLALQEVFNLEKVFIFDLYPESAEKFAGQMQAQINAKIEIVKTPEEAVRGWDLVVTAGPWTEKPLGIIQADWLAPGAFASPVDMDTYWSFQAINQADIFCLDDLGQFDNFKRQGSFAHYPVPSHDLGKIAAGLQSGRTSPEQRTIGLNIGMALDDVAVAPLIYNQALEKQIGIKLDL
ncbi:MAG: ornithine cyclodeaminase family protein [Victivallales bacterium]